MASERYYQADAADPAQQELQQVRRGWCGGNQSVVGTSHHPCVSMSELIDCSHFFFFTKTKIGPAHTQLRPRPEDDGRDAVVGRDHEGVLSLPRLGRGVVLAWLLVLGTGLLMISVLLWMGTGPSPSPNGAQGGLRDGGLQGRKDKEAAASTAAAAGVAPAIGAFTRFVHARNRTPDGFG